MGILGKLFGPGPDDAALAALKVETERVLDAALAKARAGETVPAETLEEAKAAFGALYAALSARHGTEDNRRFKPHQQGYFYTQALKLTALRHPEHDAWPVMADVRRVLLAPLRKLLATQDDPWLRLCAIQPALLQNDVKFARECFSKIEADPFLSSLAIAWANDAVSAFTAYNEVPPAETFLRSLPRSDPWNHGSALPESKRWPLLVTVYPFLGRDPRQTLGDPRSPAAVRIQLERDWDITDRESTHSTLEWLWDEGHRAQLQADLDTPHQASSPERGQFVIAHRPALEKHHILAWDFSRLISVARGALTAGFLDEEEATSSIRAAAEALQGEYGSWKDLGDDYVLGQRYLDPESVDEQHWHVAMVRWLQRDPRSPWRRVPFGGEWEQRKPATAGT